MKLALFSQHFVSEIAHIDTCGSDSLISMAVRYYIDGCSIIYVDISCQWTFSLLLLASINMAAVNILVHIFCAYIWRIF